MMLPQVANAVAVTEADVTVTTPDGTADCYFVHPASGTAAGVLIWPDIFGLRPAFRQMGKRLARVRLLGARRESVLSDEEGADRAERRGDADRRRAAARAGRSVKPRT